MNYPTRELEKLNKEWCLASIAIGILYVPFAIVIGAFYYSSRLLKK